MSLETQKTINRWQFDTFGTTTLWRAFERMQKEYWELRDKCFEVAHSTAKTQEEIKEWLKLRDEAAMECADVLITLYRVAHYLGVDNLDELVDRKMHINRTREWDVDGSGNGQHK